MNEIVEIVSAFAAQVDSGKAVNRRIGVRRFAFDLYKAGHDFVRNVGFERNLFAYPIGTFFGNGFLG